MQQRKKKKKKKNDWSVDDIESVSLYGGVECWLLQWCNEVVSGSGRTGS